MRNDLYAFECVEPNEILLPRENRGIKTAFLCALEVAQYLDVGDGNALKRVDRQQPAMQTDTVESLEKAELKR